MTSTIILSSYVALVLFFILPKVVLTFESVDKVLKCAWVLFIMLGMQWLRLLSLWTKSLKVSILTNYKNH